MGSFLYLLPRWHRLVYPTESIKLKCGVRQTVVYVVNGFMTVDVRIMGCMVRLTDQCLTLSITCSFQGALIQSEVIYRCYHCPNSSSTSCLLLDSEPDPGVEFPATDEERVYLSSHRDLV